MKYMLIMNTPRDSRCSRHSRTTRACAGTIGSTRSGRTCWSVPVNARRRRISIERLRRAYRRETIF